MSKDQYVRNHYNKIAENYGLRSDSTLRDSHLRVTEIDFIIGCITKFICENDRYPKFLDAGCGNGYALQCIREAFPDMPLRGFEYNEKLLGLAKSRNLKDCEFYYHDIREPFKESDFDCILTERVVVNLHSRKQQLTAFKNIRKALRPQGRYILIESFQASLDELNAIAQENNQELLVPSEHNFYLKTGTWHNMIKLGFRQMDAPLPENFLSTYFVLTRVFHPMLRDKEEKRLNNRLIKFFVDGLRPDTGDFSPLKLQLLYKIS